MTSTKRSIELLSPARDCDQGMEAIRCGADAVYIGAAHYGARAAAGNTVEDIARLVDFAHLYGAKVYVTINTILYDEELDDVRRLAEQLAAIGVDALITQDLAMTTFQLPLPLHASTQMDIRSVDKARFLSDVGFKRLILARELSIEDIRRIHDACKADLEVFVHGALCVSYSGQCYASQYCFHRSANRGECAQFCRLAFDLEDADGNKLIRDKHLLSLRDMNRSQSLEELMDAGVTSFKIEGRLKDRSYVKNVTAFYRQRLDEIMRRRTEFVRASHGQSHIDFTPDPIKSFNRGFTDYFLHGRTKDVASFDTPKSIGQPVGEVKDNRGYSIRVAGLASFSAGDGLCYFDATGKLQGFRVNRAESNVLYPATPQPLLKVHTPLYRNHDAAFEHQLSRPTAERTLAVDINLRETENGFALTLTDETGLTATANFQDEKAPARTPQRERVLAELSKLGGTCFTPRTVTYDTSTDYFLPAARVAEWRRKVVTLLMENIGSGNGSDNGSGPVNGPLSNVNCHLTYEANVSNAVARDFYLQHGATEVDEAMELHPVPQALLMTCRHCLRFSMGMCTKERRGRTDDLHQPLFLVLPDGRRFRLEFDCKQCQMKVYATD